MNKLLSLFSSSKIEFTPTKKNDKSQVEYPSPPTQSKIRKIFELENYSTSANKTITPKIIYNEKVFFDHPSTNPFVTEEEMNKAIDKVLKSNNIEPDRQKIIKVNLNINNNYYGSNFNFSSNITNLSIDDNNFTINEKSNSDSRESSINNFSNVNSTNLSRKSRFDLVEEDEERPLDANKIKSIPCKGGDLIKIRSINGTNLPNLSNKSNNLATHLSNNHYKSNYLTKKASFESNKKEGENFNLVSIPCLNCNSLIDLEEIENHSNNCLIMKEDVLNLNYSVVTTESLNAKLKKFDDFILRNKKSDSKDAHYYISLSEYINTAMKINEINDLNITSFIEGFRGSFASLISIERSRVLINEKFNFFKEEKIKMTKNNKNSWIKETDELNKEPRASTKAIEELHKAKQKMLKERERIQEQKLAIVKVANSLKKEATRNSINNSNLINLIPTPRQNQQNSSRKQKENISLNNIEVCEKIDLNTNTIKNDYSTDEIYEDFDMNNTYNDQKELIDNLYQNVITPKKYTVSEINSDVENSMYGSEDKGDCTSVSAVSDDEFEIEKFDLNKTNKSHKTLSSKYKNFVQIFLKVKFEKFHNTHGSSFIEKKDIWLEALRQNIEDKDLGEFILNELKNYQKYQEKAELAKQFKLKKMSTLRLNLDIINEEAN